MEVNGQLHAPASLPRGEILRYPLYRSLSGPQSRFVRGGEEKKKSLRCQEFNPGRPARRLVTTLTAYATFLMEVPE